MKHFAVKIAFLSVLAVLVLSGCKDFWHPEGSQIDTYMITFITNGGSSVQNQTVISGTTATRPVNPTRNGYIFISWYTDPELNTFYYFNTGVTGDISLYAGWYAIQSGESRTIIFEDNPGYGWVAPREFVGNRILQGDEYIFIYSFRSNIEIDTLDAVISDGSEAVNWWRELSKFMNIGRNISAYSDVSGAIILKATGNATGATSQANIFTIHTGNGTLSAPTLTFSTYKFAKVSNISVIGW
jgi:uncharacterized repeat protein (TIGR02543 family)